MPPPSPSSSSQDSRSGFLTFSIVAGCAILFSSKGVVVKMAYAQGADPLTVLTLRMGLAFPFFVGLALLPSRGAGRVTPRDCAVLVLLAFLGYYASSLLNFIGLQYVSVALERIILYTYPTLVLALSRLVLGKAVRPKVWLACVGSWLGIVAAFAGEPNHPAKPGSVLLGAMLVFASALTYAVFLMLSGKVIPRIGSVRFTGMVVGLSCVMMVAHYGACRPIAGLLQLPAPLYWEGATLALLGTVAPALLMSAGLRRAGVQRFAVISTIGPVTTLFLAWVILGERPSLAQTAGFLLTLVSGLAASLLKET